MVIRVRLFLVSYAPLAVIVGLRTLPSWRTALYWWAAATLATVDGWRLLHGSRRRGAGTVVLTDVRDQGGAVAGYLATYLLPFITSGATGVGGALAYVVYFGVALTVYVRSDLALVNPTLYLFGWRVVEAYAGTNRVLVVCRKLPPTKVQIRVVDFLDVYIVKDHES
jgi:hypothetical protein